MSTFMVFLHILGAAVWAGGLVFVGWTAVAARRALPPAARIELFRVLGTGFLWLAGLAAVALAISGTVLVEDRFGGWGELGGAPGGDLVVWKTALYAAVLALALIHALGLGPRIRRLHESELEGRVDDADRASLRRVTALSASAQGLMLVGTIAILALAADLVS